MYARSVQKRTSKKYSQPCYIYRIHQNLPTTPVLLQIPRRMPSLQRQILFSIQNKFAIPEVTNGSHKILLYIKSTTTIPTRNLKEATVRAGIFRSTKNSSQNSTCMSIFLYIQVQRFLACFGRAPLSITCFSSTLRARRLRPTARAFPFLLC